VDYRHFEQVEERIGASQIDSQHTGICVTGWARVVWHLGNLYLGGVAGDEVVHGLLLGEARDGRQHTEGVAAQQDEVLGVGPNAGDPGVVDEVDGVGCPRVLRYSTA
jgi:hypothetical protein